MIRLKSPEEFNSAGSEENEEIDPQLVERAEERWGKMTKDEKMDMLSEVLNIPRSMPILLMTSFSIKKLVEGKKLYPKHLVALVNLLVNE